MIVKSTKNKLAFTSKKCRELLLIIVSYKTSLSEVNHLKYCLSLLKESVGYAVVVNQYEKNSPIDKILDDSDFFLLNSDNPGYGSAVNRLVNRITKLPDYIGVLNTDISWELDSFERVLLWLKENPDVVLSVPQIISNKGEIQKLCKHNPTLLALFSRRFIPSLIKPFWLKKYDQWYVMSDQDYMKVFDSSYLSGCCMLIKSEAFIANCGFDERYFLYLEDADLTRSLSSHGRCIHLPIISITHKWGRGNYKNPMLMLINLMSAFKYFIKWGLAFW